MFTAWTWDPPESTRMIDYFAPAVPQEKQPPQHSSTSQNRKARSAERENETRCLSAGMPWESIGRHVLRGQTSRYIYVERSDLANRFLSRSAELSFVRFATRKCMHVCVCVCVYMRRGCTLHLISDREVPRNWDGDAWADVGCWVVVDILLSICPRLTFFLLFIWSGMGLYGCCDFLGYRWSGKFELEWIAGMDLVVEWVM